MPFKLTTVSWPSTSMCQTEQQWGNPRTHYKEGVSPLEEPSIENLWRKRVNDICPLPPKRPIVCFVTAKRVIALTIQVHNTLYTDFELAWKRTILKQTMVWCIYFTSFKHQTWPHVTQDWKCNMWGGGINTSPQTVSWIKFAKWYFFGTYYFSLFAFIEWTVWA